MKSPSSRVERCTALVAIGLALLAGIGSAFHHHGTAAPKPAQRVIGPATDATQASTGGCPICGATRQEARLAFVEPGIPERQGSGVPLPAGRKLVYRTPAGTPEGRAPPPSLLSVPA
jgi:hypothetical protein